MIFSSTRKWAFAFAALSAVACKRPAQNSGIVTAVIDGVPFTSTSVEVVHANGALQFNAIGAHRVVLTLQAAALGVPKSVDLKPFLVTNYGAVADSGGVTWSSFSDGGSGKLVFATSSSSSATGTFSFVAAPITSSGAKNNRTVTDGKFDLRFQ
jgi:hypothetical protein